MRKILLLAIVVIAFASCNNCGNNDKVETPIDSLNYAFGYMSGVGMEKYLSQVAENEEALLADKAKFLKGFEKAFSKLDDNGKVELEAWMYAVTFNSVIRGGVLFDDKKMTYVEDVFIENFEKALRCEVEDITYATAMKYIDEVSNDTVLENGKHRKAQIDSLNMVFAVVNAIGVRKDIFANDSTGKYVDTFLKAFNEARNDDDKKLNRFEGARLGMQLYLGVKRDSVFFGNAELLKNEYVIKRGVVDAINCDSTVMTVARAKEITDAYYDENNKKKKVVVEMPVDKTDSIK